MWYLNVGVAYTCDDWGLEVWEPSAPNYTLVATQCHGVYEKYYISRGNQLLVKIHTQRDLSLSYSLFYYSTESELCYEQWVKKLDQYFPKKNGHNRHSSENTRHGHK